MAGPLGEEVFIDEEPESARERHIPLSDVGRRPKISLQQAARDGREDVVRYYLERLSDEEKQQVIDARDSEGYAALHYAAKFNRFQIMVRLITHEADPDPQSTEERFTPLHFSCRYLPNVRDDAPDIGSEREGDGDAVRITTAHTCRKAVQLLIKCRNLDVNAKNIYGVSSLHMACSRGNAVALEELLTSPSLDVYITDNHGDTALHEACLLGDIAIVQMLLTAMDKKGMNVLLPNHDKQTPLHFACKKGFTDVVKLILRYGKHQMQELVTARDTEGNTPLHFAAESGKPEIVKCIVICRAADIEAEKEDETTPLHIASRHGRLEVAKLIVTYNKKTTAAEDVYQQTPLHFAAKYNHTNMIQFLLEEGADIEAEDANLNTPLLVAAGGGHVDAVATLIRWKADVDTLDKNRRSIVFIACEQKRTAVLKALLIKSDGHKPLLSAAEGRALCRAADSVQNTPLHIAAKNGHIAEVKVLLTTDVKVDARNDVGKTPLHLAAEAGHAA
jgi:ankyrin repeat protein